VLGWVVAGPLLALATAAELPPSTRFVGPETALYLEITRPGDLLKRYESRPLRGLVRAVPGLEKAVRDNDGLRQLGQVVAAVAEEAGKTPREALNDLFQGGLTLAVEGPNRALLVVRPRDEAALVELHEALLKLARREAERQGNPDPVRTREYRGLTGYQVAPQEAHTIVDGLLVIATGADLLRAAVDRALDGGPSIAKQDAWSQRRAALADDATVFGYANMERLRELNPAFLNADKPNAGATLLLGPWYESLLKAPWLSATMTWNESVLGAELTLPPPPDGLTPAAKRFIPPGDSGAAAPLRVPGLVGTVSLWRDLSAIWEVRGDLFPPEAQQGLSQLDTTAGTFFGGRDFGTGVLGAIGTDWRLVVARQDEKNLDPVPDVKLPAFALVAKLNPEDKEFAIRLAAAFQSFIALANLGAAQSKAPPLMIGSDTCEGITITTAKFAAMPGEPAPDAPVPIRHNLRPSMALVGDSVILGSALELTKDLIKALKQPVEAPRRPETLVVEADGTELARLVEQNRTPLALQNMLDKGNDRERAEAEVDLLARLVRYLGRGSLTARDSAEAATVRLTFDLNPSE
jgi:hypothetical protein